MNLATIKTSTTLALSKGGLKIKKYSPEILMAAGIIGFGGTVYLACKAALKTEALLDEHAKKIEAVQDNRAGYDEDTYSTKEYNKDLAVAKTQTIVKFTMAYGPAVSLFLASTGCVLGAHNIMKKRNVALVAAYKLVEQSFAEYRKRVVDELGADKDFHFAHDTDFEQTTEEETDPNTGKTKKVKKMRQVLNGKDCSMYARLFDKQIYDDDGISWSGSSQWSPNAEYNATTLVLKCNWANDHLKAHGYLFLNELYDELGFPKTQAGQAVGWVYDGNGDNYISFGPEVDAIINKTEGFTDFRDGRPILVDFNVDGVMWDMID